ncbi:hypothetical protein TeGR_g3600 [Tetraparma gracilis]|uniref:RRM domain-containing protein n=1 Tax=Tetraparma gracilis TaxID=2962635 RepID=A0ABQ6MSZ3_9STRA|nr:hypothetical protein TeGR_g3600 [Tetraparma gracilis]
MSTVLKVTNDNVLSDDALVAACLAFADALKSLSQATDYLTTSSFRCTQPTQSFSPTPSPGRALRSGRRLQTGSQLTLTYKLLMSSTTLSLQDQTNLLNSYNNMLNSNGGSNTAAFDALVTALAANAGIPLVPTNPVASSSVVTSSSSISTGAIAGIAVGGALGLLASICGLLWCRRRSSTDPAVMSPQDLGGGAAAARRRASSVGGMQCVDTNVSDDGSFVNSTEGGPSMRPYRGAAPFGNQPFRDEFDDYKDEGLEALRSDVNTCVEDADGMMSQAMTFAFMDPDFNLESEFAQPMSTIKLEVNVLCDAYDWVKRMDNASLDERRAHMQMSLNKMVMMVRQGIIDADAASRAIHNCAAFLGLELATSVPKNTVVVTGLRKTCTPQDLHDAFGAFGKISEAEVADGGRGFALVRFRSAKSADRVLSAFKRDEIVVQDVAVVIKPMRSGVKPRGAHPPGGAVPFDRPSNSNSTGDGDDVYADGDNDDADNEDNFKTLDGSHLDGSQPTSSHSPGHRQPASGSTELDTYRFPELVRIHRKSESDNTNISDTSSLVSASLRKQMSRSSSGEERAASSVSPIPTASSSGTTNTPGTTPDTPVGAGGGATRQVPLSSVTPRDLGLKRNDSNGVLTRSMRKKMGLDDTDEGGGGMGSYDSTLGGLDDF